MIGVFFIPVFYVILQRVSERQWPFRRTDKDAPVAGGGTRGGVPAAPVDSNQP